MTPNRMMLTATLIAAAGWMGGCTTDVDSQEGEGQSALEGETCEVGDARACELDGQPGTEHCDDGEDGPAWSECFVDQSTGATPLVLAFRGEAVAYSTQMRGSFDLTGLGVSIATDWPTAATPWLAIDRDGSGTIDGGEELFGSASRLASGGRAEHGFQALAELDANGDGSITAADPSWTELLVWTDRDGDRVSDAGELTKLAALSVEALHVEHVRAPRCDARRNCEIERARFDWRDGDGRVQAGALIDVHLAFQ
jgi:hypothetical protein